MWNESLGGEEKTCTCVGVGVGVSLSVGESVSERVSMSESLVCFN